MRHPLLFATLLFGSSSLAAERVLVLPLVGPSPAVGEALSVWLTEDLGRAPTLDGVPRSEVETAMPTGSDAPLSLNLDYAVTGSWAKVGDEITLIATLGATEARSTGPAADFVLLEQQLVAQLLAAVGTQASPGTPPTERFEALEMWGEGLLQRRAGDPSAARRAFSQALALDPEFGRAREDLTASKGEPRVTHAMTDAQDAILAEYGPTPVTDQASLVGFALRMMALENEGRHCERADEMSAYLKSVGHEVSLPSGLTEAAFATAVATEARALGFSAVPRSVSGLPPAAHVMPQRRVAGQFATTADFVFREASARNVDGSGLYGAIVQCDPSAAAQERVAAVAKKVYAPGQADQLQKGRPAPGWTLRESFELAWASIEARTVGDSAQLGKRLDALTTARDPSDPVLQQLLDRSRALRSGAAKTTTPTQVTSESEVIARIRGAADGAANVVQTEPSGCAQALESTRGTFYAWSSQLGTSSMEDTEVRAAHIRQGASYVAALSELGCFVGTKARHVDAEAVRQSVRSRLDQLPPGSLSKADCAARVRTLRGEMDTLEAGDASATSWLLQFHALSAAGCTSP
ncbi:MAG: hypothetical protein KC912_06195 [Proteobacteria bacterium]|nr:hypothetical protein [Pseudomonadota bacterium]